MTQSTNYFFKQSSVVLKDNLFDVFSWYQKSYAFYEQMQRDN